MDCLCLLRRDAVTLISLVLLEGGCIVSGVFSFESNPLHVVDDLWYSFPDRSSSRRIFTTSGSSLIK